MPTTIKLKNSVTTTNAPSSLEQGEVAINITDKKVWVGNAATTPIQLLGDGGSVTFTSLTVTGVATFSAGTVSAPSITTSGDTNTGIFFPAADTIAFTEGGAEAMRIDSSGNVRIANTAGNYGPLFVGSTSLANPVITIQGSTSGGIQFANATTGSGEYNGYIVYNHSSNYMALATGTAERMRIDSSGKVGIGTTTMTNLLNVAGAIQSSSILVAVDANTVALSQEAGYGRVAAFGPNSSTGGTLYLYSISSNGSVQNGVVIDSSGKVGIGTTSPGEKLEINSGNLLVGNAVNNYYITAKRTGANASSILIGAYTNEPDIQWTYTGGGALRFTDATASAERMRITSGGNLLVGKTADDVTTAGLRFSGTGTGTFTSSSDLQIICNRLTNDGTLILFRQDNNDEGSISVSGTTVSYNGGHLSRWSQLPNNQKDDTLLKGTVMSNLDDMCVWTKDGETLPNEQLNKMKVSDAEGDTNVAGVFVSWQFDEQCQSDDMNVAMTGDMIIRIAQGVIVQKGDLLMSAGDGTAKPQGDDIVRSKTIAKVTSNHVTCTYADGSYCVPCVLMAC